MEQQVTWWLWQFAEVDDQSLLEGAKGYGTFLERLIDKYPDGVRMGLMVKTSSGRHWQSQFDPHPLAIESEFSIELLRKECETRNIAFGMWAEPRGGARESGIRIGEAMAVGGYMALDVEPYIPEFDVPLVAGAGGEYVANWVYDLYDEVNSRAPSQELGLSMAVQPSGMLPFGDAGLSAWFSRASWMHCQAYYDIGQQLHPDTSHPYLDTFCTRYHRPLQYIPTVKPHLLHEWLGEDKRYEYVDLWRL